MSVQELVEALEDPDAASLSTSVRQPKALQRALREAVKLGFASSANEGVNQALRAELEAFAQRQALDEHYIAYPEARPSLDEVALELARLDHDGLAEHPDLIAQAAQEIVIYRPDADADDVLLWAASLLTHLDSGWVRTGVR
jgi:Arc/MetJ-type ribon-helix-helix transcriptional regulator